MGLCTTTMLEPPAKLLAHGMIAIEHCAVACKCRAVYPPVHNAVDQKNLLTSTWL